MTETRRIYAPEISLFAIGTALLRRRRRIALGALGGALIAGVLSQLRPVVYTTTASFIPQGAADSPVSGLAGLAGQFGVSLPSGNQINTPDFYVSLLKTRTLFAGLVDDTLIVAEAGGKRIAIPDLLGVRVSPAREEETVRALKSLVATTIVRPVGIVEVAVSTRWPSVSAAIASALLDRINEFTKSARQHQAAEERLFFEERMAVAAQELRQAEDSFMNFDRKNAQVGRSPHLTSQRDRLARSVAFRQQLYTQVAIAFENGRIKEVRDAPGITVIEKPLSTSQREPRHRVLHVLVGTVLGGVLGVLLTFWAEWIAYRRREGDPHVDEFFAALGEMKVMAKSPAKSRVDLLP